MWLKKTIDGWKMVFNQEADVVEILLASSKLDEATEKYKVELAEENGEVLLKITWGT